MSPGWSREAPCTAGRRDPDLFVLWRPPATYSCPRPPGALLFRLNPKRAGWAGTRPSRLSPPSATVKPIPSRTVVSSIILGSAAPC